LRLKQRDASLGIRPDPSLRNMGLRRMPNKPVHCQRRASLRAEIFRKKKFSRRDFPKWDQLSWTRQGWTLPLDLSAAPAPVEIATLKIPDCNQLPLDRGFERCFPIFSGCFDT
jgi:hypothetical protein